MDHGHKKIIQICLVAGISLLVGAVWLLTFRYNLQGGFRKKIDTAKPVQASESIGKIEEQMKTFKENFKKNKAQINQLIEQQK